MLNRIDDEDLNHVLFYTKGLWSALQNSNIFLTGSTSFVGPWLIESFLWINDILELNARFFVLVRDKNKFSKLFPRLLNNTSLVLVEGDVETFDYPTGKFSHLVHAATFTDSPDGKAYIDRNTTAFNNVMEFAVKAGVSKVLFTSSGAVYGKHFSELTPIYEDFLPNYNFSQLSTGYGLSKFACEFLCNYYSQKCNIQVKIARLFTFSGPYLGLNYNYAIGNFVRDLLDNKAIHVANPGKVYRSYLYGADLATWLWTILFKGKSCYPYNVGSDKPITIVELAKMVAEINGTSKVIISSDNNPVDGSYVPAIERAKQELGLDVRIDLSTSISKMIKWNIENRI